MKETCIEYIDEDKIATFYSAERKWINKILRLAEDRPGEVTIIAYPDDNDGAILAHIPKSWMKVSPPAKRTMTDEQRTAAAERLRLAREKSH